MKKIMQKKGIIFIFISLILLNTMPQILYALVMLMRNYFLTNFEIGLISVISWLICYGLLSVGIAKFVENENTIKGLLCGIPLLGAKIITIGIEKVFAVDALWFDILMLILYGLLYGGALLCTIAYNKKLNNKYSIKYIGKLLLTSLIIYIVPELIVALMSNVINISPFALSLSVGLIYGVLVTIGVIISCYISENEFTVETDRLRISKILLCTGSFIIIVSVCIVGNKKAEDNVSFINTLIGYSITSGDIAFDESDIMTAKDYYDNARSYYCAYNYAIDNTYNTSNCSSDLLSLFKTLNNDDALNILKQEVNNKKANYYEIEALMKLMKDSNDKDISKMTKFLIKDMHFQRETVLPFDLDEQEKIILKSDLSKYEKHLTLRNYIDVYVTWLNEGELNSTVISTATRVASEHPEELGLQAEAIKFYVTSPINLSGSSSIVDNFVKLTKDTISSKSKEDIIKYKTFVAYAYKSCNNQNKVISFLEEFEPNYLNTDMGNILLVAYKKNGEHDKAAEMALKVLKEDEYNVEALSYLATYRLQSNLDESLEYITKLADIIKNKKDNYLGADIALGVYRVYLTGYYESPDSKFCPYHNFYNDMSDEQKAIINDNEILKGYFIGYNLTDANLDTFNKIIDNNDYVSFLHYYRGSYYNKKEQYEKAVKDLEKAVKELGNNNPFLYSELGFAYEGVGDLQKSLEAFEKASQYIDEYGLGYLTYNYNNIHNYFNVYINNAKHAMYESEGDHNGE